SRSWRCHDARDGIEREAESWVMLFDQRREAVSFAVAIPECGRRAPRRRGEAGNAPAHAPWTGLEARRVPAHLLRTRRLFNQSNRARASWQVIAPTSFARA